ncbi:MAG: sigma-70 family RNA polymerase sigma factor [Steroidobacteraceae bacterium]
MANGPVLDGWRRRWNRSLLQFLGRRVRSAIEVEDLAQEIYLRLLRAPDLQQVRNPQAYLLRVAGNVVAEWRRQYPPMEPFSAAEEDTRADECLPELTLDATLSEERLNRQLSQMSPTMRAVVLLRLRDEYSYKQVAQELDLTLRQVRRYLTRGYERLRDALEA